MKYLAERTGLLEFRGVRLATVALPFAVSWTGDTPKWICVHVLRWGFAIRWHRPSVVRVWRQIAEMKAAGLTYASLDDTTLVCNTRYRDPRTARTAPTAHYCDRCGLFYDAPSPIAECRTVITGDRR